MFVMLINLDTIMRLNLLKNIILTTTLTTIMISSIPTGFCVGDEEAGASTSKITTASSQTQEDSLDLRVRAAMGNYDLFLGYRTRMKERLDEVMATTKSVKALEANFSSHSFQSDPWKQDLEKGLEALLTGNPKAFDFVIGHLKDYAAFMPYAFANFRADQWKEFRSDVEILSKTPQKLNEIVAKISLGELQNFVESLQKEKEDRELGMFYAHRALGLWGLYETIQLHEIDSVTALNRLLGTIEHVTMDNLSSGKISEKLGLLAHPAMDKMATFFSRWIQIKGEKKEDFPEIFECMLKTFISFHSVLTSQTDDLKTDNGSASSQKNIDRLEGLFGIFMKYVRGAKRDEIIVSHYRILDYLKKVRPTFVLDQEVEISKLKYIAAQNVMRKAKDNLRKGIERTNSSLLIPAFEIQINFLKGGGSPIGNMSLPDCYGEIVDHTDMLESSLGTLKNIWNKDCYFNLHCLFLEDTENKIIRTHLPIDIKLKNQKIVSSLQVAVYFLEQAILNGFNPPNASVRCLLGLKGELLLSGSVPPKRHQTRSDQIKEAIDFFKESKIYKYKSKLFRLCAKGQIRPTDLPASGDYSHQDLMHMASKQNGYDKAFYLYVTAMENSLDARPLYKAFDILGNNLKEGSQEEELQRKIVKSLRTIARRGFATDIKEQFSSSAITSESETSLVITPDEDSDSGNNDDSPKPKRKNEIWKITPEGFQNSIERVRTQLELERQKNGLRPSYSIQAPESLDHMGVSSSQNARDDYNKLTIHQKLVLQDVIESLQFGHTNGLRHLEVLNGHKAIAGVPNELLKSGKVRSVHIEGLHRLVFSQEKGVITVYRCHGHYDDHISGLGQ